MLMGNRTPQDKGGAGRLKRTQYSEGPQEHCSGSTNEHLSRKHHLGNNAELICGTIPHSLICSDM